VGVTTVRLNPDLLKALNELARKKKTDRSTVMKQAIELGVREIRFADALKRYQEGRISAWRAAREAGVSLWEFIQELKKRGTFFKTDEAEMERMLEEFG